jgi:hypothetical protein
MTVGTTEHRATPLQPVIVRAQPFTRQGQVTRIERQAGGNAKRLGWNDEHVLPRVRLRTTSEDLIQHVPGLITISLVPVQSRPRGLADELILNQRRREA